MRRMEFEGHLGVRLPIASANDDLTSTKSDHILIRAYGMGIPKPIVFILRTKEQYLKLLDALQTAAIDCGFEERK